MRKIYYADKTAYPDSKKAVLHLLSLRYGINNAKIIKTDNGKPYLQTSNNSNMFFSVSHTKEYLFIVFSDKNIGIDAENLTRRINHQTIIPKFTAIEQNHIRTKEDFLRYWTAKESSIKWIGGTIANDLKKLTFIDGHMYYQEFLLPVFYDFLQLDTHLICICSEYSENNWDFENF